MNNKIFFHEYFYVHHGNSGRGLETKLDEEAVLTWQLGTRVHFKAMKVMALE